LALWVFPALQQFHQVNPWSRRDAFVSVDVMRRLVDVFDELEGTGQDAQAEEIATLMQQYAGLCAVTRDLVNATLPQVVALYRRIYSPTATEFDDLEDDDDRTIILPDEEDSNLGHDIEVM
jgi:ABC-type transporter Mla subunit MlaD